MAIHRKQDNLCATDKLDHLFVSRIRGYGWMFNSLVTIVMIETDCKSRCQPTYHMIAPADFPVRL